MKKWLFLVAALMLSATLFGCGETQEEEIEGMAVSIENYVKKTGDAVTKYEKHPLLNLWEQEFDLYTPTISPYLVKDAKTAIVLFPDINQGTDLETAEETAKKLNEAGYSVFIVDYRAQMVDDALRAIRFVRYYASEFGVSQVVALGFQDGAGLLFDAEGKAVNEYDYTANDAVDSASFLADAVALGNPEFLKDDASILNASFPTMFVFYRTGYTDASYLLTIAEEDWTPNQVRFELHAFDATEGTPKGFAFNDASFSQSYDQFLAWLAQNNF